MICIEEHMLGPTLYYFYLFISSWFKARVIHAEGKPDEAP